MPANNTSDYKFKTKELTPTAFVEHDEVELDEQPAHVVTMLHGIRDHGIWALDLQHHSRKHGLKILIQPVSYGWLGALPFLLRIGAKGIEEKVLGELDRIFELYPGATHSLVAHSNGTKIISRIVDKLGCKYKYIIFCGSVCMREDAPIAGQYSKSVINDCSPIDFWPLIAQIINPWHYEATGTYGFRRGGIEDRFFSVAHGGCLTAVHFTDFILPIIFKNTLRLGETPKSVIPFGTPVYVRLIFSILFILLVLFYLY
jgi:hypothetical protein